MSGRRLSLPLASVFSALLLLVTATQAQTTDNKKPVGTIAGRVTLNERGVADILVVAQLDRMRQPAARARTDAGGHYRLTGLAAGQYQVQAIAPALVPAGETGDSASFANPGVTVVLAANEQAEDVDIKLVRGGVITGRVTDTDNKPVIDRRVNVQLLDQTGNVNSQQPAMLRWYYQLSQTDDRGIYRIYGLPAGKYRVSIGSTEEGGIGQRNTYYPVTFYGDTADVAKAALVELQEGGEATNIDIRVGRVANTFVASGRVIDAGTGQPIPGLRLMYGPNRANQSFYGGFASLPTNARGEFRLEGLQPGQYGITYNGSFNGGPFYSEPLLFQIVDADATNLELKATRGLTISGVVVFEGPRAKELQQQFAALSLGVSVTSPTTRGASTSASGTIAADGRFQVDGVRPGKLRFWIGGGPSSRAIAILRVERVGVDVLNTLELQPGESISDLHLVAAAGDSTIRGSVTFVGGQPPANPRFFISVRRQQSTYGGGTWVDSRGKFAITNLMSGTYDVMLNGDSRGLPGERPIPPLKQTILVPESGEAQADFIIDLTPKEGRP